MSKRSFGARMALGGVVLIILALVAACGAAEQPPVPTPQAPAPAQPPAPAPAQPQPTQAPLATPALPAPAPTVQIVAPTSTPAGTAKVVPTGTFKAAIADIRFPVGIPRFNQVQSLHQVAGIIETPFAIARAADGSFVAQPRLALSWTLDKDFKFADVKIRRGVQFHEGWGEMTAEDVAWSFNDANGVVNPESVHDTAGDLGAMFKKTDVIDAETVRFNFNVFASNWATRMLTDFWEGPAVYSKKVFDRLGVEGMRDRMIGTGPFKVKEYSQAKLAHLEAFLDHWQQPPYVQSIQVLEVPEGAARRAMFETGEVLITNLDLKDWPDMLKKGYKQAPEGYYGENAISFAGNWWESKNVLTGEPLVRTLDLTKPWVGDPNDPARMESALKVRYALGYAIDREALNKGILVGLGRVGAQPGWPIEAKGFKDEWKYPYDLAKAKQLLKEAGYENGFTADWWVGPSGVGVELAEAIAGIWEAELKVKTNFDKTVYNASFRPSIIKRSVNKLFWCGTDGVNVPNLWPKGFLVSSVSSGGFGCGIEHAKFGEIYIKMAKETDTAKLEALAIEFHDELRKTGLQIGVVDVPNFPLYNPDKIAEWKMRPEGKGSWGGLNSLWTVKLK